MSPRTPCSRICCLDLDTFFVSVERLLDPSLVGRPVVVGASPGQRGVVTAASYEVRAFGVKSGMSATEARRLAPHAVFLPTRHSSYGPYALRVKAVLERYCPVVRTASIDEFFLDFLGCEAMYHRPGDADADATILRVVRELRERIQREVGLPASVGIGSTRAVAKMASNLAKPAGVFMVPLGGEREFVARLPVRAFPGIGPVAGRRLADAGVHTLGQLLSLPPGPATARFEGLSRSLRHGIDPQRAGPLNRDRPAFREHDPVGVTVGSISNERTFREDLADHRSVLDQLHALVGRTCWRARKRGVLARTIGIKLRYADFETLSRSITVPPTWDETTVYHHVRRLYLRARSRALAVRLVGGVLSNLVPEDRQLPLPFNAERRPRPAQAIDSIRERFGYGAIRMGTGSGRSSWVA